MMGAKSLHAAFSAMPHQVSSFVHWRVDLTSKVRGRVMSLVTCDKGRLSGVPSSAQICRGGMLLPTGALLTAAPDCSGLAT